MAIKKKKKEFLKYLSNVKIDDMPNLEEFEDIKTNSDICIDIFKMLKTMSRVSIEIHYLFSSLYQYIENFMLSFFFFS